jgi:hypothetical protein
MAQESTLIHHGNVARLIDEAHTEMLGLAAKGKPFIFLSHTGAQMHGGDGETEHQVREFAVMTQKLLNEVNKFCLEVTGKDYNEIVLEEFKARHNMVADQEIPDNSEVNKKVLKNK